ncbi:unnamed protein product [Paramecium octaurelia]|uniref:Uncharacterized protein n=1 Tax=Paramecium octaurelia TaxID=43137 RepID=A0A8S1XCK2_PAROT|nr:unnamed protein product [Paramecium octaurelia]
MFYVQELLIIFFKRINLCIQLSILSMINKSWILHFNVCILKGLHNNHMKEIMSINLINLNNLFIKNNSNKVISKVYIEM